MAIIVAIVSRIPNVEVVESSSLFYLQQTLTRRPNALLSADSLGTLVLFGRASRGGLALPCGSFSNRRPTRRREDWTVRNSIANTEIKQPRSCRRSHVPGELTTLRPASGMKIIATCKN